MNAAATIPAALLATVERGEGQYVFHLGDSVVRLSCAELAERALRRARRLVALGVRPGDAVGVLGPNHPEWVAWAFAVWMAGAALVPVQKKLHLRDPGAFTEQLRVLLAVAGCRRVLVDPAMAPLLPAGTAVAWDEVGEASADPPPLPGPDCPAVIQFTSGSTATPRGALITHAAAIAQMGILDGMACGAEGPRRTVSWVPFFHDMGLFLTVLGPAVWGGSGHFLPTERFARDPAEWFRLAQSTRATLTLAPSAAFGSTLRALGARDERVDLGSLEMVRLVAEAVDPEVARRLLDAAPRLGLRPEALGSGYGLAEAVLAVAYSPLGSGLRLDRVSLEDLTESGVAVPADGGRERAIAACGPPLMDLRIVGPAGPLPDRHVGEILLRGPSTMSRYLGPGSEDPFAGGWLRTGDLGYMADGQLHVTGRIKDMVIAMGHNYYPEDFEWAASRIDGVRPGRSVAFGLPGSDDVVVLVEVGVKSAFGDFTQKIADEIADVVGVRPSKVVILPSGSVEKTTSGKLRRAKMREAYADGSLADWSASLLT